MADQCRSCGRNIIWAMSPKGRRIPLDASPVTVYAIDATQNPPRALDVRHTVPANLPQCDIEAEANIGDRAFVASINTMLAGLDTQDEKSQKVYLSHFVTCPDAPSWRRAAGRRDLPTGGDE